jgi:hypothetical protein
MKIKSIFRFASFRILVLTIGVCVLSWILSATSPAQSLPDGKSDVYLLGIIDPDDRKHIWALPAETTTGISRQLAAKYPRQSIDGVIFYRVSSWRDTANLVLEAHARQGALMVDLINRIERINRSGPDRKLARRVTAIEKRLNESLDSGYR